MHANSASEPQRSSAGKEIEALLMLWALMGCGKGVTEEDLQRGLTARQWQHFQHTVGDLLTEESPVSEKALDKYFLLLKTADDMWKKLYPKRKKRRNLQWHDLRKKVGDAYGVASAELARVIVSHPSVTVMLFPVSHFHDIRSWIELNQCAGHMPGLKRKMTGYQTQPIQCTEEWQQAAFEFVRSLIRKKYPQATAFQSDTFT